VESVQKLRFLVHTIGTGLRPGGRGAEAAQWYNERQLGLVEKFIREVDEAIVRILENPLAFPIILRRHEVRRVLTKRFPYRIFSSLKDDAVVVHAVLHGHRDDRHWEGTVVSMGFEILNEPDEWGGGEKGRGSATTGARDEISLDEIELITI
jgi:toxin ParE1/3/4